MDPKFTVRAKNNNEPFQIDRQVSKKKKWVCYVSTLIVLGSLFILIFSIKLQLEANTHGINDSSTS